MATVSNASNHSNQSNDDIDELGMVEKCENNLKVFIYIFNLRCRSYA